MRIFHILCVFQGAACPTDPARQRHGPARSRRHRGTRAASNAPGTALRLKLRLRTASGIPRAAHPWLGQCGPGTGVHRRLAVIAVRLEPHWWQVRSSSFGGARPWPTSLMMAVLASELVACPETDLTSLPSIANL
jgi:hypothetical protein